MLQMMNVATDTQRLNRYLAYGNAITGAKVYNKRISKNSNYNLRKNLHSRKNRIKEVILARIFTVAVTFSLIVCLSLLFANKVNADNETHYYKYYQTYTVQNGDSLWKIAGKFAHDESRNEYMKEVMEMNNMYGDYIVAGQKIVIPYYSTEFNASTAVAYTNY